MKLTHRCKATGFWLSVQLVLLLAATLACGKAETVVATSSVFSVSVLPFSAPN
jgi:hypothetical protein